MGMDLGGVSAIFGHPKVGPLATIAAGATLLSAARTAKDNPPYGPPVERMPSLYDPAMVAAGLSAARRAGPSSGRPDGLRWSAAPNWAAVMPVLGGRQHAP